MIFRRVLIVTLTSRSPSAVVAVAGVVPLAAVDRLGLSLMEDATALAPLASTPTSCGWPTLPSGCSLSTPTTEAASYLSGPGFAQRFCTGAPAVDAAPVQDVADRGERPVGELSQLAQGPADGVLLDDERLNPGLYLRVGPRAGGARELRQRSQLRARRVGASAHRNWAGRTPASLVEVTAASSPRTHAVA
jgi:hypothetical protein